MDAANNHDDDDDNYEMKYITGSDHFIRAQLSDGSIGPIIGKIINGDTIIDVEGYGGSWAGDLLRATIPCTSIKVPDSITSSFQNDGVCVWENAMDQESIANIRKQVVQLKENGILRRMNHGQSTSIRTDSVGYCNLINGSIDNEELDDLDNETGAFVDSIETSNIVNGFRWMESVGAAFQEFMEEKLLCPPQGMIAVYPGNNTKYVEHYDNDKDENGRWRNFRCLTMVFYINTPDFDGGGELEYTNIHGIKNCIRPKGGTLAIFNSRKIPHAVLEAQAERYAMSLWFVSRDLLDDATSAPCGSIMITKPPVSQSQTSTTIKRKRQEENKHDVAPVVVVVSALEEEKDPRDQNGFGFRFFD